MAAHSMVRALFGSYAGPLYEVHRASDNATKRIGVVAKGGLADSAAQEAFCGSSTCRVLRIFDQTESSGGASAHLDVIRHSAADNCSHVGHNPVCPGCGNPVPRCDTGVNASRARLSFGAGSGADHAFAASFEGGMGYHFNGSNASGIPTGDAPESMYAVLSGTHVNDQCCVSGLSRSAQCFRALFVSFVLFLLAVCRKRITIILSSPCILVVRLWKLRAGCPTGRRRGDGGHQFWHDVLGRAWLQRLRQRTVGHG
eukprot:SAG22_NODE_1918_length_3313_cov_4.560361_5_plen_256_part_00